MLYEALVEEIKRKAFIAKSMGQEFTDENYLEEIEKSMGRAQMGEVRTWGGKEYIKTPKGWRPKPKGYKDGGKKEETSKFNDKGGEKFELEVPGKGGAQISAGDGKFEVKVWDKDYKYITDDSKRHVFDSQAEAERFARELLNEKGEEKKPKTIKDILDSKVVADFIKNELPKYNNNLDDDNQITERVLKDLIMDVHEQWSDKERTPLNGVFSGKSELTEKHLKKLVDFFWEDLVG